MVRIDPVGGVPPLVVRTTRSSLGASDGGRYTMGRDPECDVYLDDPRVSRVHAALRVVDGGWVLEDLSSRNGTWLDGERVYRLEITGSLTIRLASADDGPVIQLEVPASPPDPVPPAGGWNVETPTIMGPVPDQLYSPPPPAPPPPSPPPPSPPPPGSPWGDPGEYQGSFSAPAPPEAGSPWGAGGEYQGSGQSFQDPGAPASGAFARPQETGAGQGYDPAQAAEPARYLRGQCPDGVRVGETFSVLAGIALDPRGGVPLKSFVVPPGGRDVLLVLHAPGLEVLSAQRQTVRVPATGDSEPVMFELRAPAPGPCRLSITAWIGGTYLGELAIDLTVAKFRLRRPGHLDLGAPVDVTPAAGEVSLVVRHDPVHNAYRFEFRDEDNPAEVTANLAYQAGPVVERMLGGLEMLARGRAGYSAAETRDYLVNAGAGLWQELLPPQLREQFWERRDRIGQLTILAEGDTVPWELLYPFDRGRDAGFLVEQFPVTRAVFGRRLSRSLRLSPAWFVLPDGSPAQAREEVTALLRLFGLSYAPEPVIGGLTPLLDHIKAADFGLLHFACHNAFDPAAGSAISLDQRQFTPTQLTTAAVGQVLAASAPTVFINACRSAGANPSYQQLDGWASKFLDAGAAAFIGSLWAVRDTTAREFAAELYGQLQAGATLGDAVMRARRAAADEPGDPTWLAYAVYGDPRAALR
jgi:hypothetical protein